MAKLQLDELKIKEEMGEILTTKKQIWVNAWIAVAASTSCVNKNVATGWANECLNEFEKRFKTVKNENKKNK